MASKTSISNRCLAKIGETRVSNIANDSSKKAQIINDMWDEVRDALQQSYPWNFTIKRASVALSGTSPEWGFNNKYLLPVDFLSLLEIRNDPEYEIIGGYIETNSGAPLKIKYIARVEDVGLWDAMFNEAFASQLAVETVESITQSNTKKQILMSERDVAIKQAFAADAIQEAPQNRAADSWLLSRENYISDDIDYNA